MKFSVCIVGGGPSGIACGFYLKRFGFDCCIFEKEYIGGLIRYANRVENIPFISPLSGIDLVRILKKYIKKMSLNIFRDSVIKINLTKDSLFKIIGKNYYVISKYIILATGTLPYIPSAFDSIKDYILSFEKNFFKISKKKVAIIGGGDIAFDYAISLALKKNSVSVFVRNIPKTYPALIHKALSYKNINCHLNSCITRVNKVKEGFIVEINRSNKTYKEFFEVLIPACGRIPYYGGIEGIEDFLKVQKFSDRVLLCGDVKNGSSRFLVNCFSDAINIAFKIKEMEYEGYSKSR